MTAQTPDAIHMIHIQAPAQKIWDALTDADLSPSYFFGNRTEIGPQGGRFQITQPGGALDTEGVVLIRDEPRLLRVSWQVVWLEELRNLPPVEVEYRIEDLGNGVCTLTASEFNRATDRYVDQARQGWSLILSSLKPFSKPAGQWLPSSRKHPDHEHPDLSLCHLHPRVGREGLRRPDKS